jgi:ribose transport system substrate-binding protein
MKKILFLTMIPLALMIGCAKQDQDGKTSGTDDTDKSATNDTSTDTKDDGPKKKFAFVTNGIASFWVIAEKGANDSAAELGVDVHVRMPPKPEGENQQRMVEDLLAKGVDGIAISPIDPSLQQDMLAKISKGTTFITHDSDAPDSDRKVYIGVDNYDAGRMCGKLVKEAIPDGGEVMIYIGRLGQDNAKRRRQGVIDELLDRKHNPDNYDDIDAQLKGSKYTILGTRLDDFEGQICKAKAQDDIVKHQNMKCMVGLFAYEPPEILEAVTSAKKLGSIKIVAFDEADPTLQGIKDGTIHGTTVQNPYQYGYLSVKILNALANGDESLIPIDGFIDVPARNIRKDNVDEFWAELKTLTAKKKPAKDDKTAPAKDE